MDSGRRYTAVFSVGARARSGTAIFAAVQQAADADGELDWDNTLCRWHRRACTPACRRCQKGDPESEALGRSQGDFNTKLHIRGEGKGKLMTIVTDYWTAPRSNCVREADAYSSSWRTVTIGELGRVITGRTPPTERPEYFGNFMPFITPTDMEGHRVIPATQRGLSPEGARLLARNVIPTGVGVSCIGWQMGKTILIERPSVTNQQLNSVIPNPAIADPCYLYYSFSCRRDEFFRLASGGSRTPILKKSDFEKLPVVLPPLPEQRAIASLLGALDDKIELNCRVNVTLEAMARAIFQSWIVDFDPVRAKAEGRETGLPAEIAALFPAGIVESEFGEMPEGWEVLGLNDVARFLNGLALQKYPPTNNYTLPVIKITQLRAGHTMGSDSASADIPAEYIVGDGDVLFSWSGSLECVHWAGGTGALNQHLFKVTSATYPKWFCYFWIHEHLANFRLIAAGKATTMGHIQRHHLNEAKVVVPPRPVVLAANKSIEPLFEMQWRSKVQNRHLANLRDALLPKLVSGELRILDAYELIDEVIA